MLNSLVLRCSVRPKTKAKSSNVAAEPFNRRHISQKMLPRLGYGCPPRWAEIQLKPLRRLIGNHSLILEGTARSRGLSATFNVISGTSCTVAMDGNDALSSPHRMEKLHILDPFDRIKAFLPVAGPAPCQTCRPSSELRESSSSSDGIH